MPPAVRKFALAVHLTASVGWIGAVVAYLALALAAMTSDSSETMRSAWLAMEVTGWFTIVPLALASLATGMLMALGTTWGLFRHYWVLLSFLLTVFSVVVLLLHMPTASARADVARQADAATLDALGGALGHPAIGLVVLVIVQVLNIYKPRGMTRYGQRKQREHRASARR